LGYNATGSGLVNQTGGSCTAGALYVGNSGAGTYTISGGTLNTVSILVGGGSGTGTMNMDGGVANLGGGTISGVGMFTFAGGTVANVSLVNMAVTLGTGGTGAVLQQDAGYAGLVSGKLSGAGPLTKTGGDKLTLSGANDYTGLTIVAGGTLEIAASARDPILTLGGKADVLSGQLVFDYSGGSVSTILATIQTAVNSGTIYAPTSSAALICLDNLADAVTVKSTLFGDADINGTVNGADLNAVLSNYNTTVTAGRDGWQSGDFNHDGTVNGADLNTVLSNYNQSLSVTSAVPEPSALLLAAAGLAGLWAYALRKQK
jgi:autotransporter-associated beta strand protein